MTDTPKPMTEEEISDFKREHIRVWPGEEEYDHQVYGRKVVDRLIATIDHLRAQRQSSLPPHRHYCCIEGRVDGYCCHNGCKNYCPDCPEQPESQEVPSRAQRPTAIHDPEKLWEKHSYEDHVSGDQVMNKDQFLVALAEVGSEQWISMEEGRLPKVGEQVLVYKRPSFEGAPAWVSQDSLLEGVGWEHRGGNIWFAHDFEERRITHWQPLPQPPKVTK